MTAAIPHEENERGYALGGTPNIQRAWMILAGGAEKVAEALVDIAENGNSEPARVQAATTVLRMVGFGNSDELRVKVIPAQYDEAATPGAGILTARQQIENRMAQLREPAYNPGDIDDGIVEAEIVESE